MSCLGNGKHRTENHATKVTKRPKTKSPKYVMSREIVNSDQQIDINKKTFNIGVMDLPERCS